MKLSPLSVPKAALYGPVAGAVVALIALGTAWGGSAYAEPAQDNATKVRELSQQADELSATLTSAQADLDQKMRRLADADRKYAEDLAALNSARAQLAGHQEAVDKLASAVYMGGRTDGFNAVLTAASPTNLIDKLTMQRVMGIEMSAQMKSLRGINQEAQRIEAASAESAAATKAAVDEAVAVRANLQRQQSDLEAKITAVAAQYRMLPPAEQAALAGPDGPPAAFKAALSRIAPVPTVGMGGLVPNARSLAAYIMSTYPGVQSIGGVRADPLPDHPSGRAIDIMIGSNMALGDAINADIQSQAARFGVSYTMWRVAAHFDHVHITVN